MIPENQNSQMDTTMTRDVGGLGSISSGQADQMVPRDSTRIIESMNEDNGDSMTGIK